MYSQAREHSLFLQFQRKKGKGRNRERRFVIRIALQHSQVYTELKGDAKNAWEFGKFRSLSSRGRLIDTLWRMKKKKKEERMRASFTKTD